MKSKSLHFFLLFFGIILMGSCVTRKKLTYLQYSEKVSDPGSLVADSRGTVTPVDYKVIPFDILYVRVITPDPQWSELFNVGMEGGGSMTQESAALFGYNVDSEGNIEIPYVGKVHVEGKTLSEIKTQLDGTFKNYLNDAALTVKLVNNFISVIGEVNAPGRYILTKDRINIFEAISMAGDLSDFSNRQKVQIIRPSVYGPIVKEFNLLDRSILTSDYYYVRPNDIIYAQPMKGRTLQMNASLYSAVLTSVATLLTILVFFRPSN